MMVILHYHGIYRILIYKAVVGVGVSKGTCVGFVVSIGVGASVGYMCRIRC